MRSLPLNHLFFAMLVMAIPLNALVFALDNLIYLLYPYRIQQEGLEIFLRTMLTFTGKGLLFALAMAATTASGPWRRRIARRFRPGREVTFALSGTVHRRHDCRASVAGSRRLADALPHLSAARPNRRRAALGHATRAEPDPGMWNVSRHAGCSRPAACRDHMGLLPPLDQRSGSPRLFSLPHCLRLQ